MRRAQGAGPAGAIGAHASAARRPEDLAVYIALAAFGSSYAAGLMLWITGQLAGMSTQHRWPAVPASAALSLLAAFPRNASDPRAAWPAAARDSLPGPVLFYVVFSVVSAVAGSLALFALSVVRARRAGQRLRLRDGSASWATAQQVRLLRVRTAPGHRVVLGRLGRSAIAAEPRRSVMVIAPTQAGKTSRFVVPTVLRWDGPMLVTSVKSDVLRLTIDERRRRGGALIFDPTGLTGFESVRWSPLLSCATYESAERTASWLVEASGDSRSLDNARFWESLGSKLLAPLLFAAAATGGHIAQVARWVNRREVEEVDAVLDYLGDLDALDAWAATCAREARQRDSVYATAETILKAFSSPSVRTATSVGPGDAAAGRALDIRRLLDDGQTLYLVSPEHEQDRLRPLFESLVQSVLREAQNAYARTGQPLRPALMLMLDEAANIAPLRKLDTYAATGAGMGIQICSIWQNLAQVTSVYGKDKASTVVNGHTARVFLPGSSDLSTLEDASRMIGDHDVSRVSVSASADGVRSVSESTAEMRVAPVEYLRQLSDGSAIVLYGRLPAMRLRTTAWYEDRELRPLVHPEAARASDEAARNDSLNRRRRRENATGTLSAERVAPVTHQDRLEVVELAPNVAALVDTVTGEMFDPRSSGGIEGHNHPHTPG
ncbi:MAG: type IV secretory system conjugative DNA transfer family protein [Mycobacteriales bacterium]